MLYGLELVSAWLLICVVCGIMLCISYCFWVGFGALDFCLWIGLLLLLGLLCLVCVGWLGVLLLVL